MKFDEIVIDALLGLSLWGSRAAGRVSLAGVGFMAIGIWVAVWTNAAWHAPWPICAAFAAIAAGAAARVVFVLTGRFSTVASSLATLLFSLAVPLIPGPRTHFPPFAHLTDSSGLIGVACVAAALAAMWVAQSFRYATSKNDAPVPTGSEEAAGAAAAGLAGALCVLVCSDANSPFVLLGVMTAVAFIAGMGSPVAPLLAAALLALLARIALPLTHQPLIVDGIVLVLVLTYLPAGVWPLLHSALRRLARKPAGARDGAA